MRDDDELTIPAPSPPPSLVRVERSPPVSPVGAICLAAALLGCAWLFATTWERISAAPVPAQRTIEVSARAAREVESDRASWKFRVQVENEERAAAYRALRGAVDQAEQHLRSKGVKDEALWLGPMTVGHKREKAGPYVASQSLYVIGRELELITELSEDVTPLVDLDVPIGDATLLYHLDGVDDVVTELVSEATRVAEARARKLAGDAGAALGPLVRAEQRVMNINPVHDFSVTPQKSPDTKSFRKTVVVVVSVTFELGGPVEGKR